MTNYKKFNKAESLTKAFNSMDKALELVNELNNKYLEMAEIK